MKKYFEIILILFVFNFCGYVNAQTKDKFEAKDVNLPTVEISPVFAGSNPKKNTKKKFAAELDKYVMKRFKKLTVVKKTREPIRLRSLFKINSEGKISDIRVSSARGYQNKIIEQELINILTNIPQMTHGKHKGENVNTLFSLPINL